MQTELGLRARSETAARQTASVSMARSLCRVTSVYLRPGRCARVPRPRIATKRFSCSIHPLPLLAAQCGPTSGATQAGRERPAPRRSQNRMPQQRYRIHFVRQSKTKSHREAGGTAGQRTVSDWCSRDSRLIWLVLAISVEGLRLVMSPEGFFPSMEWNRE